MAQRFSVEAVFKAVDRMTAPVTRMQNRVGRATRSMDRGFRRLNRTVDKFSGIARRGAFAATAALGGTSVAILDVIKTGAEFEQTLVSAAAKFPGEIRKGTKAFELLAEAAKKTGKTTEFTATQSAQALNFLAMAGFTAESSVSALPGVVNLATVAALDLGTASDIATDSIGAFGLATKDATQLGKNLARINDVIAKTTTTSNTSVVDMFEAIKDGGPAATLAGVSIETFAALVGTLANAGTKASRAGTTMKNIFLRLSGPAAEGARALRRLGIRTADSGGNLRDVVDILGDLNTSLKDMGTATKTAILKDIFGRIPIAGVGTLLKAGAKQLRVYRRELTAVGGASKRMAEIIRDTVIGRFKALVSAIEGVKIRIFDMNSGPLSETIDKMTAWVRANESLIATNIGEWLADMIGNLQNTDKWLDAMVERFATVFLWTKRIGAALVAYAALATALKLVSAALFVVNFALAASPLGLILLAVAALSVALAALVVDWDALLDRLTKGSGIVGTVARFLGLGGEGSGSQVVSPQDRAAQSIEERVAVSRSEVTIRDETGRAKVTSGKLGRQLTLIETGSF